ncbi:4-oxalocrotonate tautomerase [Pseudoxanthomonas sp. GM95]|uniref:tautomerase family protein n=1 Tax=Pseudoxanthomonas sp. GM95 TaxID=1881043 RepID=UPI0008C935EF|nr:tautomerase family protein [Pseudoxanthomonas sp. GM95]SEL61929.1 4-oxalocrotonate tautomerase [Pseudoxanthomonas sp. GM95]
MPEVVVFAVEGRTAQQKKNLMKAITDAVAEHFTVDPAGVVVQIVEAPRDSKSKGGVPYNER